MSWADVDNWKLLYPKKYKKSKKSLERLLNVDFKDPANKRFEYDLHKVLGPFGE